MRPPSRDLATPIPPDGLRAVVLERNVRGAVGGDSGAGEVRLRELSELGMEEPNEGQLRAELHGRKPGSSLVERPCGVVSPKPGLQVDPCEEGQQGSVGQDEKPRSLIRGERSRLVDQYGGRPSSAAVGCARELNGVRPRELLGEVRPDHVGVPLNRGTADDHIGLIARERRSDRYHRQPGPPAIARVARDDRGRRRLCRNVGG